MNPPRKRNVDWWKFTTTVCVSILATVLVGWFSGYKNFITDAQAEKIVLTQQRPIHRDVQYNSKAIERLTADVSKLVTSQANLTTKIEVLVAEIRARRESALE